MFPMTGDQTVWTGLCFHQMGKKVVQLPDKQLVNEKPFENQKPLMYVLAREVKFSNI